MANADKLFEVLIEYIKLEGVDFYKKFTVEEIGEILDICREKGRIDIKDNDSYNYAITSMFSNQKKRVEKEERDYFDFIDIDEAVNLTSIAKEKPRNNYKWKRYGHIELYINEKYIDEMVENISKAGDNEKDFIMFMKQKSSIKLQGKKVFGKRNEVNISVDNYFELDGKRVYVEIDSGNMAKLLVGQYTLLHSLSKGDKNSIFFVIHYYKGFNAEITKKNLDYVRNNIFKNDGMKFLATHIDDFKKEFSDNEFTKLIKSI